MHVQQNIAERLDEVFKAEVELCTYTDVAHVQRGIATRDVYIYVASVQPRYDRAAMAEFEENVRAQLPSEYSFRRSRQFQFTGRQVSFGEYEGGSRHVVSNRLLREQHVAFQGGLMLDESYEYSLETRIYVRTVPDSYLLSRLSVGVGRPLVSVAFGWRDRRRIKSLQRTKGAASKDEQRS